MSRDSSIYLTDILSSINKIKKYVVQATRSEFFKDERTIDAVLRNLEIIGEAAKHVPPKVKLAQPDIQWKKIAGLRDILSHEYFNVNADIIWDVIQNKLGPLQTQVSALLGRKKHQKRK